MNYDLVLGMLLVQGAVRRSPAPRPEETPLPPIDFAALRRLGGRAPEPEGPAEAVEPLRIAA